MVRKKPKSSAVALVFLLAACAPSDDDVEVALDPEAPAPVGPRAGTDKPPVPSDPKPPQPPASETCQAAPTVKASVQLPGYGYGVFLDGDQVYWFEPVGEDHPGSTPPYTLFRAHINALHDREALAASLPYARFMQRVRETLVWTEGNYSGNALSIHAMELDGSGLRELPAYAAGPIGSIRAQDGEVYWAGWVEGTVGVVSLDGGASTVLAAGVQLGWDVAADESYVYAVDERGLLRVPRAGGELELLSDTVEAPIRLTDEEILWIAEDGVRKLPKEGGPSTTLVAGEYSWFDVLDGQLYLSGDGGLTRRPLAGGPAVVLSDDSDAFVLTSDADCFYWYDYEAEEVWQITRRP